MRGERKMLCEEEVEFVERKINKICVYRDLLGVIWYERRRIDFSGGIFMVIKENVILINYMIALIVFRSHTFNKLRKCFYILFDNDDVISVST